jgi:hypothetical protein
MLDEIQRSRAVLPFNLISLEQIQRTVIEATFL